MQRNTFTFSQAVSASSRATRLSRYFKALGVLMLVLVGASQGAWAQVANATDDVITLTTQPTGGATVSGQNFTGSDNNGLYSNPTPLGLANDPNTPPTPVPQLGTYDLNGNSILTLTGAQIQGILGSNQTTVSGTRLEYRVYLENTPIANQPGYTNLTFTTSQSGSGSGSIYNGSANSNINLLNGLTSGGTYVIDVRFATVATRGNNTRTSYDPSSDYFYANFYVTPPTSTPPGGTTTWQSSTVTGGSTDWTVPANWSNGVPNMQANAIIPAKNNTTIVYPILDQPGVNYSVANLTLNGSGSTAAQLTVKTATLRIYGDLNQRGGGLAGATTNTLRALDGNANSTLIFAGGNQLITGNLNFSDIIVAGSGIKSVINSVRPSNIIALMPTSVTNGVIIQSAAYDINGNIITSYSFDTSGNSNVDLGSTAVVSAVDGQNETTTSYINGVLISNRNLTVTGQQYTFGNIGLDVTPNHAPGNIYVYRVVGEALQGPAAVSVPIKRRYRIEGDDDSGSNATASSTLDLVFHYLPSANELNGIPEDNLTMFRTINNGVPYTPLFGTLDKTLHTVTRLGAPSLNKVTVTLGDKNNPLPVSLATFAAVRSGDKAIITWATATEENNKGFNVQVSADGVKYRNLAFVDSKNSNSVNTLNYSYIDNEANKAGTRYYRLEQVDFNGETSFSPVRAVSFSGAAATSLTLAASPNPFNDYTSLSFEGLSTTDGPVHVRLIDMTGRIIRDQDMTMSGASVSLNNLGELRSGLYLAKVTLADGTTKTVRVQRQ